MPIKIKISDIEHLTDARYFSSKEVEYLGFNRLTTSSNDVKLIQDWIHGPQIASEFIGTNCIVDIKKTLDEFNTDVIHFDSYIDKDTISNFAEYEIFMNIDLNEKKDKIVRKMEIFSDLVDYFVLQSHNSFSVHKPILTELIHNFPSFIDLEFNLSDIIDIIELEPEGLILRGGGEERIGVKSFDQLDEIFEIINR